MRTEGELTKENLLEYAKAIGEKEVDENDTFENIYEKVMKQSYNEYLIEQENIKKSRHKAVKYEQIPQRKLVLKKDNIKVIQGIFPRELGKQHIILKCKKGKRIILLNIWVRKTRDSLKIIEIPEYVNLTKDINENLYVYYIKEPPL